MEIVKYNYLFILSSILLLGFQKQCHCQDFGYDGVKGPQHWGEQYNACFGKHQSPINIDSLHVKRSVMPPLQFSGFDKPPIKTTITNNGHTVMVSMESEEQPTISGGPLQGTYEFSQLHFHWGDNDTFGSEDHIDDKSFPMELHMVFFKKTYRNTRSAMEHKDGLSVLAIFYDVSEEDNKHYLEFTNLLADVRHPNHTTSFKTPPTMSSLMPNDIVHYYTYNGSLTTPPCSEIVTWIDFADPVLISHAQIEMFRAIQNHDGEALTHNFRPIQPIGDRTIFYNIRKDEVSIKPQKKNEKDIDLTKDVNTMEKVDDNTLVAKKLQHDENKGVKPDEHKKGKKDENSSASRSVFTLSSSLILSLFIISFNFITKID